jgi:hypothetical protein
VDNQPDCYIDCPTLIFMIIAIILKTTVLTVIFVVLRRFIRSKVLGLHNISELHQQNGLWMTLMDQKNTWRCAVTSIIDFLRFYINFV